jgi:ABC-type multidrug transport system ATPase subunit
MLIKLNDIGKKYHDWVFKGVNYTFQAPIRYGVVGKNGTGKSTLLKIVSGFMTPTHGDVIYLHGQDQRPVEVGQIFNYLNFAGPYIDLIEEFTLFEHVQFHAKFKPLLPGWDTESFLEGCQLARHKDKIVNHLSSGLMQRLKLGLCLLSVSDILLLDEPTSYLDEKGRSWFSSLFQETTINRLVVLASNDHADIELCDEKLDIERY